MKLNSKFTVDQFEDILNCLELDYTVVEKGPATVAHLYSHEVGTLGTISSATNDWEWAPGFDRKVEDIANSMGYGNLVVEEYLRIAMESLQNKISDHANY